MVTLQTADNALKSFYLDAVAESLNTKVSPFLATIERTSSDVVGKDVKKNVRYGVNGGVGAGSEAGDLPASAGNLYVQFTAPLKNLYGTIEISDKAIRASANNEGAFVNLLNDEMQGLIKGAKYNFSRMLFGDGTGKIATVVSQPTANIIKLDSLKNIHEGMVVDFYTETGEMISQAQARKIVYIDDLDETVTVDGPLLPASTVGPGSQMCIQGSFGVEITGLSALFGDNAIYGTARDKEFMKPYKESCSTFSELAVQTAIDAIEEKSGGKVNFIICSWGVRRAILEYYQTRGVVLPTVELEGGYKALSFQGIPIVVDRFCPTGTMYLLNTDDFKLHQLCDWQWLEGEDGKILKQIPGKPVYTATLVKYAELICSCPAGQGMLYGITEK
ncbi:MAG: phage major capsid protein [Clostridia bacterium]|nr:phage major capsid protein [Clostridia bacterium]